MYKNTFHILTAVHPDTAERISRILQGHNLTIVRNIRAATAALTTEKFDLIFVGARFDESKMFEFLEFLREDVDYRRIPIAAAVVVPTRMTSEALKGMSHAVKIYGASLFINLNDFPDEPASNYRVRLIFETLCAPAEAVIQVATGSQKDPKTAFPE